MCVFKCECTYIKETGKQCKSDRVREKRSTIKRRITKNRENEIEKFIRQEYKMIETATDRHMLVHMHACSHVHTHTEIRVKC